MNFVQSAGGAPLLRRRSVASLAVLTAMLSAAGAAMATTTTALPLLPNLAGEVRVNRANIHRIKIRVPLRLENRRTGHMIRATVTTNAAFVLRLPSGRYRITAEIGPGSRTCGPSTVTVSRRTGHRPFVRLTCSLALP